ncbi:MAG TPA: TIGR03790 family protein, partial [Verrucomicrobiae bacterium]|nr:TIGR03790 family protein [Verrucomicrobiae bacterium]
MKVYVTGLVLLLGLSAANLVAAEAGEQVVVVYNSRMPLSKGVADYYAQRRQVPKSQIFGYSLPASEEISRAEFRDSLQKPLAKALAGKKLWRIVSRQVPAGNGRPARAEPVVGESKIRYLVLCYGVPLKILEDPHVQDETAEPQLRPEMRRNEACVDSELALLPCFEQKLPLSGPLRNPVYGVTNRVVIDPTNGVLIVSRLDGPSPDIARGLVDKALEAEANGLWGRAYFDLRNTTDPGYKLGDDSIRSAMEICRHLGFETTVDNNPQTFPDSFPLSQIAIYMGWYAENADGPFALPQVEFMPGAFAYHLHSFSAVTIRLADHGWVAPFLAKGATATMGCVNEPYLAFTPDMSVFAGRFMFGGFSFGEAAYASQTVLSWQTTGVGDPLYRPFRENVTGEEARL